MMSWPIERLAKSHKASKPLWNMKRMIMSYSSSHRHENNQKQISSPMLYFPSHHFLDGYKVPNPSSLPRKVTFLSFLANKPKSLCHKPECIQKLHSHIRSYSHHLITSPFAHFSLSSSQSLSATRYPKSIHPCHQSPFQLLSYFRPLSQQ